MIVKRNLSKCNGNFNNSHIICVTFVLVYLFTDFALIRKCILHIVLPYGNVCISILAVELMFLSLIYLFCDELFWQSV